MRKAAKARIIEAVNKGQKAAAGVFGYTYVKAELESLVKCLSEKPIGDITMSYLEDALFNVNMLLFVAELDVIRNPHDKGMLVGISTFKDSLSGAVDFFQTLAKPAPQPTHDFELNKIFQDVAYQSNVLLFSASGEAEKLGDLLDAKQKAVFEKAMGKKERFITLANKAAGEAEYTEIADSLSEIGSELTIVASDLKERGCGGAVGVLASEFTNLAKKAHEFMTL